MISSPNVLLPFFFFFLTNFVLIYLHSVYLGLICSLFSNLLRWMASSQIIHSKCSFWTQAFIYKFPASLALEPTTFPAVLVFVLPCSYVETCYLCFQIFGIHWFFSFTQLYLETTFYVLILLRILSLFMVLIMLILLNAKRIPEESMNSNSG